MLVDEKPISGCLALAALAADKDILTIEGLADGDALHPIQEAFIDQMGFQCSYCTPGFILATKALLAENPSPTPDEVREYLAGNLCRCGSYVKILDAVLDAAGRLRAEAAVERTRT
jgi:aerobic-type carbon monoxide dehydrogenase small subunit (CoxS/CutS family)